MTDIQRPPTPERSGDEDPAPRCSAWLAAYALGLAHTSTDLAAAVRELLETAGHRQALLREAHDHLARLTHVDADLRDRTHRMLTAAIQRVEVGHARPRTSRGTVGLHMTNRPAREGHPPTGPP